MNWFRWWHGTVTDPKFRVVAMKSGRPVGEVLAVWACLLEHASSVTQCVTQCDAGVTRGNVTRFFCDDYDVLLGFDSGACKAIYAQFEAKGMIVASRLVSWDERQPSREDSSKTRTKAWRDRKKAEQAAASVTQCDASVTQCDAPEESRVEENIKANPPPPSGAPPFDDDEVTQKQGSAKSDQKPPPTKPKKKRIPIGYQLTNHMRQNALNYWARMKRPDLDPETEFEQFYSHYDDKPEITRADWEKTWCTWYQKTVKFNQRQNHGPHRQPDKPRSPIERLQAQEREEYEQGNVYEHDADLDPQRH